MIMEQGCSREEVGGNSACRSAQAHVRERGLREREDAVCASEAAAAGHGARDGALAAREAALAEREAALARAGRRRRARARRGGGALALAQGARGGRADRVSTWGHTK